MGNARLLYRLQQLDQELSATRQAGAELKGRLGESPELLAARAALAAGQQRLRTAQAVQKEREYELQKNADKLSSLQEQLYSGRIKNPKELAGLEAEAKSLMRRRDQLQDHVLEAMLEVEAAREALDALQGELQRTEARWREEQARCEQELAQATARAEQAGGERAEIAARLDAKELELYEDLRRRKGSAPVARLRGGTCGRCGVNVPVALIGQVRRAEELVFCPSCGRLLVEG